MIHDDKLFQQTRFHFFKNLKFKNFKTEIDVDKVIRDSENSSSEKTFILMSCED